jgi:hypothetical protein
VVLNVTKHPKENGMLSRYELLYPFKPGKAAEAEGAFR